MPEMPVDTLSCPYCGKSCTSKSGLTLHIKNCKKRPSGGSTEPSEIDPRSVQPERQRRDRPPEREDNGREHTDLVGRQHAFQVDWLERLGVVMVLMDANFAEALGSQVVEAGSDNPAVMAMGHQLKRICRD